MAIARHISIDGTTYDLEPSGSNVTGVKGDSETNYRTGNVNITKANIGLGNVPNVSTNNQTPTFTQASSRANITSGETLTVIFGKIMKFFADLKTVAFSGSYTDLSDKPTIPTVNNATLTIQKNGTNVQTFTANASSNKTANITVPTKTSELTNDSGYTTNTGTVTQVKVGSTAYVPSSGVVSLPAYPSVNNATLTIQKNGTNVQTFTANASSNKTANITVPTKTSELTNDSGYITDAGVTGVKGNSETSYRTGNVNITKANIGLGSVGNFKAVSTATSQGLTATEQSNARANITASGQIEVLKNTLNKNAFTITTPTHYKEIIVKCYVDNGYACDLHFYPGVDYNYGDSTLLATASAMLKYGNTSYIVYGTIETSGVLTLTYDGFTAIAGYKVMARK